MTCESATAPINIIDASAKDCKGKCDYSFFYQNTSGYVKNYNNQYLLVNIQDNTISTFNSKSYQIEEIRIYSPSLHTYGGTKADGEFLIIHKNINGPDKLIVSIPLIKGGNITQSSNDIKNMINIAAQSGVNQSSELNGMTINLNDYIPRTIYYFYRGTLPYSCGSGVLVNYVVFSKNIRNSPINIPEDILKKLNNIIKKQNVEIKPTPDEFGKSKGPPSMSGASSGGDIYIDCQPVGEEGELLVNTPKTSIFGDSLQNFNPEKYKWLGTVALVILFIMIVLAFKNSIMNFFSSIFDFIFSYKKKQTGGNIRLKRK
jgi:carbonic anhydrase